MLLWLWLLLFLLRVVAMVRIGVPLRMDGVGLLKDVPGGQRENSVILSPLVQLGGIHKDLGLGNGEGRFCGRRGCRPC